MDLYCHHSPVSRGMAARVTAPGVVSATSPNDDLLPEGIDWHAARGHLGAHAFTGNTQREAMTAARRAGWLFTKGDAWCRRCAAERPRRPKVAP